MMDFRDYGRRRLYDYGDSFAVEEWQRCPCRHCNAPGHWVVIYEGKDEREAVGIATWRQELEMAPIG